MFYFFKSYSTFLNLDIDFKILKSEKIRLCLYKDKLIFKMSHVLQKTIK